MSISTSREPETAHALSTETERLRDREKDVFLAFSKNDENSVSTASMQKIDKKAKNLENLIKKLDIISCALLVVCLVVIFRIYRGVSTFFDDFSKTFDESMSFYEKDSLGASIMQIIGRISSYAVFYARGYKSTNFCRKVPKKSLIKTTLWVSCGMDRYQPDESPSSKERRLKLKEFKEREEKLSSLEEEFLDSASTYAQSAKPTHSEFFLLLLTPLNILTFPGQNDCS